jgi:hypothetical protein
MLEISISGVIGNDACMLRCEPGVLSCAGEWAVVEHNFSLKDTLAQICSEPAAGT